MAISSALRACFEPDHKNAGHGNIVWPGARGVAEPGEVMTTILDLCKLNLAVTPAAEQLPAQARAHSKPCLQIARCKPRNQFFRSVGKCDPANWKALIQSPFSNPWWSGALLGAC